MEAQKKVKLGKLLVCQKKNELPNEKWVCSINKKPMG